MDPRVVLVMGYMAEFRFHNPIYNSASTHKAMAFFFVGVSHRVINNWHNSGDIKPIQIERNVGIISDTSGFILIFIFIIIAKSPDDDDWRGCICFSQEIINNLESINSLSRMRIS